MAPALQNVPVMKLTVTVLFTTILIGIFAGTAHSVDKPIPQPSREKMEELVRKLPRTAEQKVFCHWTQFDVWSRWTSQGEIQKHEFDVIVRDGGMMLGGGGLYLATTCESSRDYGDFGIEVIIPKGSLIFDHAIAKQVLGIDFDLFEDRVKAFKTELGKTIPFVDPYFTPVDGEVWWVTHHQSFVSKVGGFSPLRSAQPSGVEFGNNRSIVFDDVQVLLQAMPVDAGARAYLQRLLMILYYGNTSLFFRALYEAPGNLDSIMSTAQATRVSRVLSKWLEKASQQKELVDIQKLDREKWIQLQMQKVLPGIFSDLTGKTSQNAWREQVLPPTTMIVDVFQAETIRNNSALQSQIKKISDFRYQATFSFHNPQASFAALSNVLGQVYDTLSTNPAELLQMIGPLASLAPFSDANDPVIRTYVSFLSRALGLGFNTGSPLTEPLSAHPLFLQQAEDAFMLSHGSLSAGIRVASSRANRIAVGLLAELHQAQTKSAMPQYQNLPEQKGYPATFQLFGEVRKQFQIPNFLAALKKRDFQASTALLLKDNFWVSSFESVPQVISAWRNEGRFDVEAKLRSKVSFVISSGHVLPAQIGTAFSFEPDFQKRPEWIKSLLRLIPRFAPDNVRAQQLFAVIPGITVLKTDESLRKVVREFVLEEVMGFILAEAKQGNVVPLEKQSMSLMFFNSLEKHLGIHRSWMFPYVQNLLAALNTPVGRKVMALTAPLVFETSVVTEVHTAQEFQEVVELARIYFSSANAVSFLNPDSFLNKSKALLSDGVITIHEYQKAVRVFQIEKNGYLMPFFESFVEALEAGEKASAGSMQTDVQWHLAQLEKLLEPSSVRFVALKKHLDALVKPASDRMRTFSAASCSGIVNK